MFLIWTIVQLIGVACNTFNSSTIAINTDEIDRTLISPQFGIVFEHRGYIVGMYYFVAWVQYVGYVIYEHYLLKSKSVIMMCYCDTKYQNIKYLYQQLLH